MKYIEIDKNSDSFSFINLESVLSRIQPHINDHYWSIQLIDGVGNIKSIIEMNIVELEEFCDTSSQGFIIDFIKLIKLSKAIKDIIDVLIVGCESIERIPKAYKDKNWENNCKTIISKEDSSLWQFFSIDSNIMREFEEICNLSSKRV